MSKKPKADGFEYDPKAGHPTYPAKSWEKVVPEHVQARKLQNKREREAAE